MCPWFLAAVCILWLLRKLKFPESYNGENEKWILFPSHCRYFDRNFLEMFVE